MVQEIGIEVVGIYLNISQMKIMLVQFFHFHLPFILLNQARLPKFGTLEFQPLRGLILAKSWLGHTHMHTDTHILLLI